MYFWLNPLEIVFVSSDRSPEDMQSYMKESHGDWLAVEHNSTVANDLKQKYGEKDLSSNPSISYIVVMYELVKWDYSII